MPQPLSSTVTRPPSELMTTLPPFLQAFMPLSTRFTITSVIKSLSQRISPSRGPSTIDTPRFAAPGMQVSRAPAARLAIGTGSRVMGTSRSSSSRRSIFFESLSSLPLSRQMYIRAVSLSSSLSFA